MGRGVSCDELCLTLDVAARVVAGALICLTLLNYISGAMASAAGVLSAIWSYILGPSNTMLTWVSNCGGTDCSWQPSAKPVKD